MIFYKPLTTIKSLIILDLKKKLFSVSPVAFIKYYFYYTIIEKAPDIIIHLIVTFLFFYNKICCQFVFSIGLFR